MDYLRCLDVSELIEYLEIEPRKANFEMVEKILSSRSKDMVQRIDNLEKNLKLCNRKCSELSLELKENNKKCVAMEVENEEFKDYKWICDSLEEKITHLEEDCRVFSEREKTATQNFTDLEHLSRSRYEELVQINMENKDLKCEKQKADDEIQAQKETLTKLQKKMEHIVELEKELEMHKTSCLELSTTLQEEKKKGIALEGKIVEFEGCKKICEVLKEKVAHLEEDCKNASEREENAIQDITSLLADVDNKKKELLELETKNRYLESHKQQADNEIEVQKTRCKDLEKMVEHTAEVERNLELYKAQCSELFDALEEERKKSIAVEGNLEELRGYKVNCKDLKEKIIRLEEVCRNFSEKEKKAKETITNLSADLENLTMSRKKELSMLATKIKELEYLKQQSDDEVKAQNKRNNELETMVKHTTELEKDLEMCRAKCSELSMALERMKKKSIALEVQLEESNQYCNELQEKVTLLEEDRRRIGQGEKMALQYMNKFIADLEDFSRIRSEELVELKTKKKVLECLKRKPEAENKSQKKRYKKLKTRGSKLKKETLVPICRSQVTSKSNMEVGTDVSNKESNKDEYKHVQNETIGVATGSSSSKLIIKLKNLSSNCDKLSNKDGNNNGSEQGRIQSQCNGGKNGSCPPHMDTKLETLNHKSGGKGHDSPGVAANRHSSVKVSDGGQVGGPATPSLSLRYPSTTEALRRPEPKPAKGSVFPRKIEHLQSDAPGKLQPQVDVDSAEASNKSDERIQRERF